MWGGGGGNGQGGGGRRSQAEKWALFSQHTEGVGCSTWWVPAASPPPPRWPDRSNTIISGRAQVSGPPAHILEPAQSECVGRARRPRLGGEFCVFLCANAFERQQTKGLPGRWLVMKIMCVFWCRRSRLRFRAVALGAGTTRGQRLAPLPPQDAAAGPSCLVYFRAASFRVARLELDEDDEGDNDDVAPLHLHILSPASAQPTAEAAAVAERPSQGAKADSARRLGPIPSRPDGWPSCFAMRHNYFRRRRWWWRRRKEREGGGGGGGELA